MIPSNTRMSLRPPLILPGTVAGGAVSFIRFFDDVVHPLPSQETRQRNSVQPSNT